MAVCIYLLGSFEIDTPSVREDLPGNGDRAARAVAATRRSGADRTSPNPCCGLDGTRTVPFTSTSPPANTPKAEGIPRSEIFPFKVTSFAEPNPTPVGTLLTMSPSCRILPAEKPTFPFPTKRIRPARTSAREPKSKLHVVATVMECTTQGTNATDGTQPRARAALTCRAQAPPRGRSGPRVASRGAGASYARALTPKLTAQLCPVRGTRRTTAPTSTGRCPRHRAGVFGSSVERRPGRCAPRAECAAPARGSDRPTRCHAAAARD